MTKLKLHEVFGDQFYRRHQRLFRWAIENEIALCGSTAAALCKGDTDYMPNDLDFACGSVNSAMAFVGLLSSSQISSVNGSHWRVFFNANNTFCPKPSYAHIRITSSYWLPICIFILPKQKFSYFKWVGGTLIQDLKTIKEAAQEMEQVDGKKRLASDEIPESFKVGVDELTAGNFEQPKDFFDETFPPIINEANPKPYPQTQ